MITPQRVEIAQLTRRGFTRVDPLGELLGRSSICTTTGRWLVDQVAPKTDASYWDRITEERSAWDASSTSRGARPGP